MIEFRADLHCHTSCSDGSCTPEEVVRLAKQSGLQGLSITDHDTIEAYSTAIPIAQEVGIELISGVELSAEYDSVCIHILGYAFSVQNPGIQSFCHFHQERRNRRLLKMLDKLDSYGIPVSEEEVLSTMIGNGIHSPGRPHIAQAMVKKGYVSSVLEAFKLYLGEGKCCYVLEKGFTVQETIEVIHQAQGFAIIAHPQLIKQTEIVQKLLDMNFDGLEGHYSLLSSHKTAPWIKIAKEKKWIITGGSDFHGNLRPSVQLGSSTVHEEPFRLLQHRNQQNQR